MVNRNKSLDDVDKAVLKYLKIETKDIGYINSINVFENRWRVNIHSTDDKIMSSHFMVLSPGNEVISCHSN